MKDERLRRYIDKPEHMGERIGDIETWLCETGDLGDLDKKTRLAVYKAMQENSRSSN